MARIAGVGLLLLAAWACPGALPSASAPATATATAAVTRPTSTSAPSTKPAPSVAENAEALSTAVQASLQRLEQNKELAPADRAAAQDLYKGALAQLEKAKAGAAAAAQTKRKQADLPAELARRQDELAQLSATTEPAVPPEANLAQLEQLSAQASARLTEARRELTARDNEPKANADARADIPRQMTELVARRSEIDHQLGLPPEAGEAPEVTAARRAQLQADRLAVSGQLAELSASRNYLDAAGDLLTVNRDLAAVQVRQAETASQALKAAVNERRQVEAQQAVEKAQREMEGLANATPAVLKLAQENLALVQARAGADGLTARLQQANQACDLVLGQLTQLRDDFNGTQQRIDAIGLTNTTGLLLRKQRAGLPHLGELEEQRAEAKNLISQAQMLLLDFREQRKSLDNLDAQVKATMGAVDAGLSPAQRDRIAATAKGLLEKRRGYLDAVISDCNAWSNRLVDLDAMTGMLIAQTRKYLQYIDERVLWIRSAVPLYQISPEATGDAAWWLVRPGGWMWLCTLLWRWASANLALVSAAIAALAAMLILRRRMRKKIASLGAGAAEAPASFGPTLYATALTLLMVGMMPAVLWLAGEVLAQIHGRSELPGAVGAGLRAVALGWLTLGVLLQVCRPEGLAAAHFQWPPQRVKAARRGLRWLMMIGLPILFLVAVIEGQSVEPRKDTLGRLAFIAGMFVLTLLAMWHLRPARPAPEERPAHEGVLTRFANVWYAGAMLLPLALALLAFFGYYYAAVQLAWRVLVSVWLVLGVLLVSALLGQWLAAARKSLAVAAALARLALRREQARPSPTASAGGLSPAGAAATAGAPPEALTRTHRPEVGLSDMSKQTRRLVGYLLGAVLVVGMWWIWADVVPALGAMRRVVLWNAARGPTGQLGQITLADLALALVVIVLTSAAARNIPGLLQIAFLQRLKLASGLTYAITSVTRYIIVVTGVVIGVSLVGVAWGDVQWLVAAITVGLGFGLQEIFANFVSGLIILFERPIRIGDLITVNRVTGVVSNIRIRATTLVDADNKELIVPNKAFITGQVMNWTLSDTTLRAVVKLNIAPGQDVEKILSLLLTLAGQHPGVVKRPPPEAYLTGFGPTALNLELRVFTDKLENYRAVRHGLHQVIEHAFRQNNIQLA
jgi:potassium efflux system protein